MFLGDVGGSRFEEIDVAAPGANFGWPCYENDVRNPAYQSHSKCQALYAAGPTAVKAPLHAYSHNGGSAGITGGVFYTGPSTEYNGAYIYADFIKREFRSLRVNATNTAVTSGPTVFGASLGISVEIQMGPDGCLWYAALGAAGNLPALRGSVPPPATARRLPEPARPPITVGDTIRFSGHATDPEDGPVPATRLKWKVELVHCPGGTTDCHTHSLLDRPGVASGSWQVDDHGDSYRFRLTLTATDTEGLARAVKRTIQPATVTITLASSPPGLSVGFDDVTATAPAPFQAIVNSRHRISFVSPQSGREFQQWSDGGAASHDIVATTSRTLTVFTTEQAAATPRTPG